MSLERIAARALFLAALLGAWAPSAHAGWQAFSTRDGLVSNSVTTLFVDRAGRVWVGTQRGVGRFDGVAWTVYAAPDPLPLSRVNAITEDPEGNIWIGTDLGASRFDGAGWTHFESIGGVPSNPVKDILVDRAGGLWFATSLGGVTHFDGTSWTTYTTFHGFRSNAATAVYQDHEGTIWAAAYNIYRFGGASWAHVSAEETGSGEPNAVWIAEDARGRMWFAERIPTAWSGTDRPGPFTTPRSAGSRRAIRTLRPGLCSWIGRTRCGSRSPGRA